MREATQVDKFIQIMIEDDYEMQTIISFYYLADFADIVGEKLGGME